MNSGELLRLKQKKANRFIQSKTGVDSSLHTYNKQVCAASSDTGTVPVVASKGQNASTGVMQFATGKEPGSCSNYVQFSSGSTNRSAASVLARKAGCAVASNTDTSKLQNGAIQITLPCCDYEPRQRYPITNSSGVIVDYNTYQTNLTRQITGMEGSPELYAGAPDCSIASKPIYGNGTVITTTKTYTSMRQFYPS
jgi:hypothetical protein